MMKVNRLIFKHSVSFNYFVIVLLFAVSFCSTLTPEEKKEYRSLISGLGLYNEDDKIDILNVTNLRNNIYGTDNAWLVEFYNSWCGHCQKFAPIWKSLATNLYGWRNVIKLAAIDCAADENTPVCREYEVMGYPTLKFFHSNSPTTNLGTQMRKSSASTETEIRNEIVSVLQKEQLEGRGSTWPNITPYRGNDVSNLWKEIEHHDRPRYIFLIFEDSSSPLATEVILDLGNMPGIGIRRVLTENEVLAKLMGVHTYPSLVIVEHATSQSFHLQSEENSRDGFRQAIKSYLEAQGVIVPEEPHILPSPPSNIRPPDMSEIIEEQKYKQKISEIKKIGDVVFLADLENTLRYNLQHEIPARKVITGEALTALNNFLAVLAKYFPINESGVQYLQTLRDTVFVIDNELRGLKFKTHVNTISGGLESVLTSKEKWLGCRGSEKHFRGFPCGMWTLFHFMTVNALKDSEHVHFDPLEVLNAMLGYVTHFFGCTDCSKHFQEMAHRSMRAKVTTAKSAVLWLWNSHNEVNQRLANDASEDPVFPKIQFPSSDRCLKCRDANGRWDEHNVLKYLTHMYSQDNLNLMGSNTKLYVPSAQRASNGSPEAADLSSNNDISSKKLNSGFNIFDISLCVLLYIVSAVICVAVCLKFILKKRYRKKLYVHDLLGKV